MERRKYHIARREDYMKTVLSTFLFPALVISSSIVNAQSYGLPDSILFGNRDGSEMRAGLDQQIAVPVWIKTDDSVTFMTIPLATNDSFVVSRDGGMAYFPLSQWDQHTFTYQGNNIPWHGYSSEMLLGYADLNNDPRPQYYLHTNYQWVHIADFLMTTTSDTTLVGQASCLVEGISPAEDMIFFGFSDGSNGERPDRVFGCLRLENMRSRPGDANGDCAVNGIDVVYLVNYLKGMGSPPVAGDCQ
jgi:hypothetical protein